MNQQFDCHYDGDWQKCDKEMCHREKQCRRRTSGTESAGGFSSGFDFSRCDEGTRAAGEALKAKVKQLERQLSTRPVLDMSGAHAQQAGELDYLSEREGLSQRAKNAMRAAAEMLRSSAPSAAALTEDSEIKAALHHLAEPGEVINTEWISRLLRRQLAPSATPAKSMDDMTVQEFQGVLARANLLLQHKVLGDPSKGFTTPTCMCLSFPNACPVHRSPSDSSNNDR